MLILKIYFGLTSLITNPTDTSKNDVVIIGEAYNEKNGAWIYSKKRKENYFLEGIDSWDENIVVKTVKVWGKLLIEKINHEPEGKSPAPGIPPPPPRQEIQGELSLKQNGSLLNKELIQKNC